MDDGFKISQMALGKGTIGMCRMPGAVTDLQTDVQALVDFGATCVLSLTPMNEMTKAGAAAFPDALAACDIAWRHFPIEDFGTPQPAQQADWDALSAELQTRIDQGETVVIHCRAGLGRTGMVALRLMTERGAQPDDAVTRLRTIRPGTVENQAQFEWAAQGYTAITPESTT